MPLAEDLSTTAGEPVHLFAASAAPWVRAQPPETARSDRPAHVTDGPFLHTTADGRLLML